MNVHSYVVDTAPDNIVGRLVDGRYRVLSIIARGGMSTVYEANDIRLDRIVALKVMHRSFAEDPGFVARFEREAKAAARLSHPNVVAVFDQGSYDGLVFLVMEHVDGHTLREVIRAHGALEPARALGVVEQVLLALTAAHTAGFVHRDVKPENVLISDDGVAKVADFGLARAITEATSSATANSAGLIIGTVAYLSPEQVDARHVDERSDVYSTGVMLFELLTGDVPFSADTPLAVAYRHVHDTVAAPSSVVAGIPDYVDDLVLTATAKDPDERFATAWAFERAVLAAQERLMTDAGAAMGPASSAGRTATRALPWPVNAPGSGAVNATDDDSAGSRTTVLNPATVAATDSPDDTAHTSVLAVPTAGAAASPTDPATGTAGNAGSTIQSSRRGPRSLFVVAVLLLAGLVGGFAWYLGSADNIAVPDVAGQSVVDATLALQADGFATAEAGEAPSATVPQGLVVGTDPPAGERAQPGSTIGVVVSSGPEMFSVPDVQGASVGAATEALQAAGFVVGGTQQVFNGSIARDLMVGTNPPANSSQPAGTAVTLIVSRGLDPVNLPDLAGLAREEAETRLGELGLFPAAREEFSDTAERGIVITSEPEPGTRVLPGESVTLVVSKGAAPARVPRVVGMATDAATLALAEVGLTAESTNQFPVVLLDRVYSQEPAAGTEVTRGTTVVIAII